MADSNDSNPVFGLARNLVMASLVGVAGYVGYSFAATVLGSGTEIRDKAQVDNGATSTGEAKNAEAKCGEGSCGDDSGSKASSNDKSGEGKCGEGSCGN